MRIFYGFAVCLALTTVVSAGGQGASQPDILNRVMKKASVHEKSLPEVAALMSDASGVSVKLAPEIQNCIAAKKRGCDWIINTDWGGEPLSAALDTLMGTSELGYRVVGGDTVLIIRPAAKKP